MALTLCLTIVMKGQASRTGFLIRLKSKKGRDRPRKEIMNRCQAKALREGCCERKEAWTGGLLRENKMNTIRT